ncbi:hypothetical protein GCM10009673_03950 [Nesterenkonia sandarakina]
MSETDQRQDRAGEWAVPLRAEEVACWLLLMMLLPEWGVDQEHAGGRLAPQHEHPSEDSRLPSQVLT